MEAKEYQFDIHIKQLFDICLEIITYSINERLISQSSAIEVCLTRYMEIYNNPKNQIRTHFSYFESIYNRFRNDILQNNDWIKQGLIVQFGAGTNIVQKCANIRIDLTEFFSLATDLKACAETAIKSDRNNLRSDIYGRYLQLCEDLTCCCLQIFYILSAEQDKLRDIVYQSEMKSALKIRVQGLKLAPTTQDGLLTFGNHLNSLIDRFVGTDNDKSNTIKSSINEVLADKELKSVLDDSLDTIRNSGDMVTGLTNLIAKYTQPENMNKLTDNFNKILKTQTDKPGMSDLMNEVSEKVTKMSTNPTIANLVDKIPGLKNIIPDDEDFESDNEDANDINDSKKSYLQIDDVVEL